MRVEELAEARLGVLVDRFADEIVRVAQEIYLAPEARIAPDKGAKSGQDILPIRQAVSRPLPCLNAVQKNLMAVVAVNVPKYTICPRANKNRQEKVK